MDLKLPFLKYLESLIMCRYDNEVITDKLNELPIPLAKNFPEEGINVVRENLASKNPSYLKTPFEDDYPDMELLKKLDIFDITCYQLKIDAGETLHHVRGAFDLLFDKDMFEKISSLALANVTEQDIELIVQGKYNIHYDELQIKSFIRFFFNVSDWTLKDKKTYLDRVHDEDLLLFYEMALDGDKSYLMWKLGIAPQKSFEVMLQDLGSDAYYMFKEKSKRSPSEAQSWAGIFLRTVERSEKLQGDKDKAANFFNDLDDLIKEAKTNSDALTDSAKKSEQDAEAPLPHISSLNEDN